MPMRSMCGGGHAVLLMQRVRVPILRSMSALGRECSVVSFGLRSFGSRWLIYETETGICLVFVPRTSLRLTAFLDPSGLRMVSPPPLQHTPRPQLKVIPVF